MNRSEEIFQKIDGIVGVDEASKQGRWLKDAITEFGKLKKAAEKEGEGFKVLPSVNGPYVWDTKRDVFVRMLSDPQKK